MCGLQSLTETPPTIEDWSHKIEELLQGSFPFLVATFGTVLARTTPCTMTAPAFRTMTDCVWSKQLMMAGEPWLLALHVPSSTTRSVQGTGTQWSTRSMLAKPSPSEFPHLFLHMHNESVLSPPTHTNNHHRGSLSDSKGIGGKLMHALIEACRGRGFRSILAIIGSAGSVRFHKRHGFRFCGELLGVGWRWGKVSCVARVTSCVTLCSQQTPNRMAVQWSDVAYMQLDLRTDEVPGTGQYASGNAGLKAAYYEDTAAMMAAVTEAVTRRLEHKRSDSSDDSPDLSSWSRAEPASSTTTTLTTKYTESSSKHVGRLGSLLLGAALGAGAMAALAWSKRD